MTSASQFSKASANGGAERPGADGVPPAEGSEAQRTFYSLPQRQPPLASSCWLHGSGPEKGEPRIVLSPRAVALIQAHSLSDRSTELGGVLLGSAYRNDAQIFVEIEAALPVATLDHGPIHFTFTADSWAQLHREKAAKYPELNVVGWFHTHPDLGIFYSGDDVVVHTAAFTLPWQVGLVVDPVRDEASFFGWTSDGLAPISGFFERCDDQQNASATWQIVPTSVWEGSYTPEVRRAAQSGYLAPASGLPSLPPTLVSLGFMAGLASIFLGLLLVAGWLIPQNRQLRFMEAAMLQLVDQGQSAEAAASCPGDDLRIISPAFGSQLASAGKVPILGTASYPSAHRYRVEIRPLGGTSWTLLNASRRETSFGQLAVWDSTAAPAAAYELRLTAVDRNNVIIAGSPTCTTMVELLP